MAGLKVMTELSEIMMNVWKNGNIFAIIQLKQDYAEFQKNILFSGSQGKHQNSKSNYGTAWKGCATKEMIFLMFYHWLFVPER